MAPSPLPNDGAENTNGAATYFFDSDDGDGFTVSCSDSCANALSTFWKPTKKTHEYRITRLISLAWIGEHEKQKMLLIRGMMT